MPYVYFLRNGSENIFKVGRARDVDERIRQLSTGNPYPLTKFEIIETEYDSQGETYAHGLLSTRRVNSGPAKEFYAITMDDLRPVIEEVKRYLTNYLPVIESAKELKALDSDGTTKLPGNEEISIYQELLKLNEQQAATDARREYLESRLKLLIGTSDGLEGLVVWRTASSMKFDQAAFRLEQPDMFLRYLRESKSRRFLLEK